MICLYFSIANRTALKSIHTQAPPSAINVELCYTALSIKEFNAKVKLI